MHTQADKQQESSRAAAVQAGSKNAISLMDNRPGAVAQLQSFISNATQSYNYGSGTVSVGSVMEAYLDPLSMPQGQSANLNTSQNTMMSTIRKHWNIKGGNVVKGHLLNDNLGSSALNKNLYPITAAANKDHLMYVENVVKEKVWNEHTGVYYKVTVHGNPVITDPQASFNTQIKEWNPKTNTIGQHLLSLNVPSDLRHVTDYHQVVDPNDPNADLYTYSNPDKPSWAHHPKTRVSELTDHEKMERDNQF